MGWVSRSFESARMSSDVRGGTVSPLARREPSIDDGDFRNEQSAHVSSNEGAGRVLQLPQVTLAPEQRERERLLGPGCTGTAAAPYRMLRTQVLKRLERLGANTLAIVSATPGAGKTLTAINLAIAIAADAERAALLVDLDLCNPSIHRRFGYRTEIGIDDCLLENTPIEHAMFRVDGYERLAVIGARARVERSSDLVRSKRMQQLVTELRTRYSNRVVIFDLPPALLVDDALAFSSYVQAGLLVVGECRTQRDDVVRTLELLRDLPFVGTVLNGSREARPMAY